MSTISLYFRSTTPYPFSSLRNETLRAKLQIAVFISSYALPSQSPTPQSNQSLVLYYTVVDCACTQLIASHLLGAIAMSLVSWKEKSKLIQLKSEASQSELVMASPLNVQSSFPADKGLQFTVHYSIARCSNLPYTHSPTS